MKSENLEFKIKSFEPNDEQGVFVGLANKRWVKDRVGDVTTDTTFTESIQRHKEAGTMPKLLLQHDHEKVIGVILDMWEDQEGLWVKGKLCLETVLGRETYSLLKMDALCDLSVGYVTIDEKYERTSATNYLTNIHVFEVSIVTFPANTESNITSVKSLSLEEVENTIEEVNTVAIEEEQPIQTEPSDLEETITANAEEELTESSKEPDEVAEQNNQNNLPQSEEINNKVNNTMNTLETQLTAQASLIADLQDAVASMKSAPVEVKAAPVDYKAKFYDEVKNFKGDMELVKNGQIKSASFNTVEAGSATEGVLTEVNRTIVQSVVEESALVRLFGREVASSPRYEKRKQIGSSGARWEGENYEGVNGEHTGSPRFTVLKAKFGKAIAKPIIPQETLSDPFFNAEAFLMADVRKQIGRLVSDGLINGAGENQPEGFATLFTTDAAKVEAGTHFKQLPAVSGDDAALLAALQGMQFELKTGYLSGAKYVMARDVFQRVAGLKDTTGRPLMQTSLEAGVAGTIFGFDVVVDPLLLGVVYFGQYAEAFRVVEIPTSMELLRNPYKIDFCVEFNVATRIGSIVNDNEAVVGLPVTKAATRSAK
ncbi:phage major capsid protein [Shewanella oncorhynchi]|uniref:Phage major capsid protein n=1 Tax=Shewanella oncorhynchi TaxID=2726434 RepID=A0AA50KGJ3_9GAMM|nr:phage major capsid protein [Shewanella oncorhynchi]WMB74216.1 phage major capsid protein [Shewanella oncorhynchi]